MICKSLVLLVLIVLLIPIRIITTCCIQQKIGRISKVENDDRNLWFNQYNDKF